ncbi:hypothetical protein DL96DRAFT_1825982 [Flagelloscypha sp. PMI_526]|nr:hypothetical protein DL96DRAFT_1825982 [Flagelloscypha sp. PMI_526]
MLARDFEGDTEDNRETEIIHSRGASGLPFELIGEILCCAAVTTAAHRRTEFLTISKSIYASLFPTLYGTIELIGKSHGVAEIKLLQFVSWVNSTKSRSLLLHIKALYLLLYTSGTDSEQWTQILQDLSSLEILDLFCQTWEGTCLTVVWNCILCHPTLKSISFDWHMNGLEVPDAPDGTFHALKNVTHISVVPNGANSFGLPIFRRFVSLTHLAVVNPGAGYTQEHLLSFEASLPGLHILVVNPPDYDPSAWDLDEMGKIITVREPDEEFSVKTADKRSRLWTIAEDLLHRRRKEKQALQGADPSSRLL